MEEKIVKLSELEKQCPVCKGEKFYYHPLWEKYWEEWRQR